MIMSKAIIITEFAEIRNVRVRCVKCGESSLVDVRQVNGSGYLSKCSNCGELFDKHLVGYAIDLKKYVDTYRDLLSKKESGIEIWLESELKVT